MITKPFALSCELVEQSKCERGSTSSPRTVSFYCALALEIIKGVVSPDHVHIFVSAPPNLAPSEIMRGIKGRCSMKLFESFPDLKKRYWGRHFWARGYFCATSGELTEEMIKNYLEHHFEPKGDDNFRAEA